MISRFTVNYVEVVTLYAEECELKELPPVNLSETPGPVPDWTLADIDTSGFFATCNDAVQDVLRKAYASTLEKLYDVRGVLNRIRELYDAIYATNKDSETKAETYAEICRLTDQQAKLEETITLLERKERKLTEV